MKFIIWAVPTTRHSMDADACMLFYCSSLHVCRWPSLILLLPIFVSTCAFFLRRHRLPSHFMCPACPSPVSCNWDR